MKMINQRIIDHLKIVAVIPAVLLAYQLVATAVVSLWPITKPIFRIWSIFSEILICFGGLTACFIIAPKKIRSISLGVVLLFYLINSFSFYVNPFEIDNFEKCRTFNIILIIGTALLSYAAMVFLYEKRRLVPEK